MSIIRRSYLLEAGFDPTKYGTVIEWVTLRDTADSAGSAVETLPGKLNGIDFDQGTSSNQGLLELDPRAAVDLDGTDYYRAPDKATFNGLHESGGTIVVVLAIDDAESDGLQPVLGSMTGSTANVGVALVIDDRDSQGYQNRFRFLLYRGVLGQAVYDMGYDLGALLTTGYHCLVATFDDSSAQLYFCGSAVGSPASAAYALPSGDSQFVLDIGRTGVSGNFDGSISDVILYSDVLTADQVAALTAELNP